MSALKLLDFQLWKELSWVGMAQVSTACAHSLSHLPPVDSVAPPYPHAS